MRSKPLITGVNLREDCQAEAAEQRSSGRFMCGGQEARHNGGQRRRSCFIFFLSSINEAHLELPPVI